MIKSKQWLLLGCGLLISHFLVAQTTVTFTSDSTMSDAMVANGGVENQNFGAQNQLNVFHQIGQQIPMVFRTYIQYDLSSIPQNALITSATLALTTKSVDNTVSHPIYIQRVENETWYEDTITWTNQPNGITGDQLSFSHAQTSSTGVHSFELKSHVQYMVNNPSLNNGWRIRLQNETTSSDYGIMYNSSEASNSSKRPVLTVEYVMPIELTTTVQHCTAGNSDGALSVAISGGSGYTLSNMYFSKTITDTTQRGNATLSNVKTTYNLQYNAGTGTITAEDLDPGIYVLRVLDDEYYTASDLRFAFYKHILVGRDGEVTTGILIPNYQYQENVTIAFDKSTNTAPLDRANTNYHSNSSSIPLRVSDAPNTYEQASLIKYNLDFDEQLEFSTAELQIRAWSSFYRSNNSNNAVNYSLVTSPWEETSVNWNSRPTIDTSTQVYVPTTTYIGYDPVHNYDTVSILPFVEYWQANPTENYGFEMSLATYGASQLALRDYKSSQTNNNYIKFEFSVKQAVVATYNDTTNAGTLTVNAPSGDLPYTYLIHTDTIGSLASVWDQIKILNAVDSVSFFEGMEDTTSFTFANLPSGKYYVAVFDHSGAKILEENQVVNTEIEFYNSTDVELDGYSNAFRTSSSSGNGSARLRAELMASEDWGGLNFKVEALGNFSIGFNKSSQSIASSSTDLEFGLIVAAGGTYQVIENNVALTSAGSVSVGSTVQLYRDFSEYVLRVDGTEVYRGTISSLVDENGSLDMLFTDAIGKIKIENYYGKFTKAGASPRITYPECGSSTGEIVIYSGVDVSVTSATLDNNHSAATISATLVGGNYTFVDVPIGTYTLTIAYSVSPPPGGGLGYSFYKHVQVAMGYIVQWEDLENNEEISYGPDKFAIRPLPTYMGVASANSTNRTVLGADNWVQFQTKIGSIASPGLEVIYFRKDDGNAIGLSTVSYLGSAITYFGAPIDDYESNGIAPNGVWRFDQDEADFSIFNNNVLVDGLTGVDGVYDISILQIQNVEYINTVASFCNNYPIPDQFVEPKREIEGGYYLVPLDDLLRFEFNEEYTLTGNLNYVVRDFKGQPQTGLDDFTEVFGDNRLMLDVSALSAGVYILEIINDKGENWFLRFKVQA